MEQYDGLPSAGAIWLGLTQQLLNTVVKTDSLLNLNWISIFPGWLKAPFLYCENGVTSKEGVIC